jgi:single-strand DNA-binding protein
MSVNKVILLGRLGKDPEMRMSSSQTPICSFSMATSERRKDASGNWNEQTEWHNIVAFGKTAELINQYMKKGRQLYLEGRIQTRKWQDKEGKDRYTTEIIAQNVQFIGSKGEGAPSGMSVEREESSYGSRASSTQNLPTADAINMSVSEVAFDDDDIPF